MKILQGYKTYIMAALSAGYGAYCYWKQISPDPTVLTILGGGGLAALRAGITNGAAKAASGAVSVALLAVGLSLTVVGCGTPSGNRVVPSTVITADFASGKASVTLPKDMNVGSIAFNKTGSNVTFGATNIVSVNNPDVINGSWQGAVGYVSAKMAALEASMQQLQQTMNGMMSSYVGKSAPSYAPVTASVPFPLQGVGYSNAIDPAVIQAVLKALVAQSNSVAIPK